MSVQPRSIDRDGAILTTFRLSPAAKATTVHVVGDFNDWSATATPMRADPQGFEAEVPLVPGRSYRFRYLLDGTRWENDWAADDYVPNEYGGTDSVLDLTDAQAPSLGGDRMAAGHDDDIARDEPPILHLERAVDGDATVVMLTGELDISSTSILREELHRIGSSSRAVILDMAAVDFIDSSGIAVICSEHHTLQNDFCQLTIANPSASVRRVLNLMGLSERLLRVDGA